MRRLPCLQEGGEPVMPPRPWKAERNRMVTKATNEFRASVEEIAAAIVEAVNKEGVA